jgi:hypothetical protein
MRRNVPGCRREGENVSDEMKVAGSRNSRTTGTATALQFASYNFCRAHQTLRVTPAMEECLTDRVWSIEDLIALLDRRNGVAA